MNILDLYREDVDGKILSVSGGQEYRGPCPVCGGDDRFGVAVDMCIFTGARL